MWESHPTYPVSEKYSMTINLDGNGNVIGGSYAPNQFDRVDFAWNIQIAPFNGYFKLLQYLYEVRNIVFRFMID